MADPFEVRMRFISQLQHMNASVNSAQKAAHYALKYRDMDEDLHSCILEQLERSNLNIRANIMYFLEHLCDMSARDGHGEFIRMIRRDIFSIVDAVAPTDQGGAANVKVVRKVLAGLQAKSYLEPEAVAELDASLKDREVGADEDEDVTMGSPGSNTRSKTKGGEGSQGPLKLGGPGRPDKRQIEQRIEEDRERHKRLKESIWEISGADDDEFEKMWEETSDLGDDDYLLAEEQVADRTKMMELEMAEAKAATT